ncbi:hypothetical protein EVAR_684_1 [Eumeta japonica]|uniref:Uncharacterized protein n=1 Tax=Eumeta variegata TaxID=151549 RepID=A0A4C1SDR9_EUMVA|nr:hypothetical protein EVAR_684_1 [Eumeta japonica]
MLWSTWLQHYLTLPHLTEYRHEITATAVVFRPVSESLGVLLPLYYPIPPPSILRLSDRYPIPTQKAGKVLVIALGGCAALATLHRLAVTAPVLLTVAGLRSVEICDYWDTPKLSYSVFAVTLLLDQYIGLIASRNECRATCAPPSPPGPRAAPH